MATTYNIVYKNHCTPQEQRDSGGRFYLDSDCGRKLTGVGEVSVSANGSYSAETSVSTTPTDVITSKDFVFVKNTGKTDVVISLTSDSPSEYLIKLSTGESFASKISTSASVRVKTLSSTSTIEYFYST